MANQPVLITFAVPQESRAFRRALGRMHRKEIRIAHIGVGPAAAGESMTRLLASEKPRLVICTGFAGGLRPPLGTGDLVVAENLSTPELVTRVRRHVPTSSQLVFGAIISYAEPVESVADKTELAGKTPALAVDMESEAVAEACLTAAVPLLVVRAISDPADTPLPVPFAVWFDIRGQRPRILALLRYLALHPEQIAAFARFVLGLGPARRAIAAFLLDFLA